jgi:endoglucanase
MMPVERFFRASGLVALLAWAAAVTGCAQAPDYNYGTPGAGGTSAPPDPTTIVPVGPALTGLHVVGNQIQTSDGLVVQMRGVNHSGSEYQCVHGAGIFEGPTTSASIAVMGTWKINAVRIPLNEACWLGINGVAAAYSGANYKAAIAAYVNLLHLYHIVPILDLHWVGPGTSAADRLQPMPDMDHAPAFWTDVAATFAADDAIVFELFNEPFPDRNRDSDAGWQCWRDGCTANQQVPTGAAAMTYQAAGMQTLVNAVRSKSNNLVLLGGLQYSNALSQWQTYAPTDIAGNLAAAWHVYSFNACNNETCWDGAPGTLAANVPIVSTEIGENSCGGTFIDPLMAWYDAHGIGYLAWTWNQWGSCVAPTPPATQGGRPWALITDYTTGTPISGYAQAYQAHLQAF